MIAAVFAGIITLVAELIFRATQWGAGRRGGERDRGNGGWLVRIALAFAALAYVLGIGLRFALSRTREFSADAGSVELTQDPDAMISALRKVAGHSEMPALPAQLQAMLLDSPGEALGRLLATHPPLEARIAALVRYAGGHDAGPLLDAPPAPNPWGQPSHPAQGAPARAPKVSPWVAPLG